MRRSKMAYEVESQLLEVSTCNILCPCWVGEDPDNGTCDGLLGWNPEVSLPGAVPFTIQLRRGALAGVPRTLAIAAPWSGSRPLLCRMLLGADAADVRRRSGQSGMDVRSSSGDGD